MENIFIVGIAIVVLSFVWLLWLRQRLILERGSAQGFLNVAEADISRQRDMVPYLLESLRGDEAIEHEWRKLLENRQGFREPQEMEVALEYKRCLEAFLGKTKSKSLQFLEAKKDIMELGEIIDYQMEAYAKAKALYQAQKKRFPYRLASAIFAV